MAAAAGLVGAGGDGDAGDAWGDLAFNASGGLFSEPQVVVA
jgi:hypothetical protein